MKVGVEAKKKKRGGELATTKYVFKFHQKIERKEGREKWWDNSVDKVACHES